jgi:hypothetical protein
MPLDQSATSPMKALPAIARTAQLARGWFGRLTTSGRRAALVAVALSTMQGY